MGVWDEFCAVCGGPSVFYSYDRIAEKARDLELKIDDKALQALARNGVWTRSWVGLAADGSEAPLGAYSGYGSFDAADGKGEFYLSTNVTPKDIRKGARYGVGAHVACVSVLRKSLGYSLRFADVTMRKYNLVDGVDYSDIAKYHDQDFDCLTMIEDGVEWMLNDPTTDERNRKRIVDKWQARANGAAEKKPAATEPVAKGPAAKKAVAKKAAAKKAAAKKPAAKKAVAKKAVAKKAAAKKPAAKKAVAKKPAAKKPAAKKAVRR
jgi:hypothetical protein